jgi:hypothetical protein
LQEKTSGLDEVKRFFKISGTFASVALYVPLWWRIFERGTSGDYSILAYLGILWIQIANLAIARSEAKWFLRFFYSLQIILVSSTIGIVWWFYD